MKVFSKKMPGEKKRRNKNGRFSGGGISENSGEIKFLPEKLRGFLTSKGVLFRSALISLFSFLFCAIFYFAGIFSGAENLFYDARMKAVAGKSRPSDTISLVLLDQKSLDWAQKNKGWAWPWPRAAWASLADYFTLAGADALVFDVLFTEESVYGAEDDKAFADSCEKNGRVVQAVYYDGATGEFAFPIKALSDSARILGDITAQSDSDRTVRKAPLFTDYGGRKFPSLAAAALIASGASVPEDEGTDGIYVRFQKSLDSYIPYSASDILQSMDSILRGEEPLLLPEQFEGSVVFAGYYAPGLFDICATPVSAAYPGVGVHLNLLDNLLQKNAIRPAGIFFDLAAIFIACVLGSLCFCAARIRRGIFKKGAVYFSLASLLFAAGILCGLSLLLFLHGIWLCLFVPLCALASSYLLSALAGYSAEGKSRRFIKNAFRQYLSPAVIDELIADPHKLTLGGERRSISIFFSDVQGFTSISESLPPQELTSLLNDYLQAMSEIILDSGGTIDKYEGDAIIAFWNAPLRYEDHARRALEAAVLCQKTLASLKAGFEARCGKEFKARIGLNTGEAVVGNLGSKSRFDYTMIGDSVNLASRLEGLNKQFGTYTLCTERAMNEALASGTSLKFREIARAQVVGKDQSVTVFEPLEKNDFEAKKDVLKEFDRALHLFYEGEFLRAKEIFETIKEKDAPAQKYIPACARLLQKSPADWKGVWVATSK